jgi:hypothetical protein
MEAVAWMEQCIRDSHKISVTELNNVDRMEEQVERLELRNKDITEQMHDVVALIGEQGELIERQAEEIGRPKKPLAAYHGRKHTQDGQ